MIRPKRWPEDSDRFAHEAGTLVGADGIINFLRRFLRLTGGYWSGDDRWRSARLTVSLGFLTIAQVVIPVLVNKWTEALFNALGGRDMDRFLKLIGVLVLIILGSMAVNTVHLIVKRKLQLDWRRWLTDRLLHDWMSGGRQYLLGSMPGEHDNPDGRIAEDLRNTTETAIELAHSLFYCVLLLLSFTGILWSLSDSPVWTVAGIHFSIPGYLVWIAILYAAAGTLVAMALGRPLVRAVNQRQRSEADFRFGLARGREYGEAIALHHGEPVERSHFNQLFQAIRATWNRQTVALSGIMLFTNGYSVLSLGFPVMVVAPRYIAGAITLGGLMQTAQGFGQMAAALSWPIDNLSYAATWRASVERVMGLHEQLERLNAELAGEVTAGDIVIEMAAERVLSFHDLQVATPTGDILIDRFSTRIAAGERVVIDGDQTAANRLFKVVAGLWPWGQGRVELPVGAAMFFLPGRPYLPVGTLRAALTYPAGADAFAPRLVDEALERVGLAHLLRRLDQVEAWEQELSAAELQKLGFARVLLHRPDWIFLQEATDTMSADDETAMMRILCEDFAEATIIGIGFRHEPDWPHLRRLVLERKGGAAATLTDFRGVEAPRRRRKEKPQHPRSR